MGYDSSAYDFSLFEPQIAVSPRKTADVRGNAVPARKPDVRREAEPRKKPVKKAAQKRQSFADSYQKTFERSSAVALVSPAVKKLLIFGAICFVLINCLLYMRAETDALVADIADVKTQMSIAKSENVRLNAELSAKMSSQKIDDYAENVLGMVKAEGYQITYIDLSEGDEVVVSGEKSVNADTSFSARLKEFFAYIF